MKLFKEYGPRWMGLARYFPYPFRAMKLSIDLKLFPWLMPSFVKFDLSERVKADGETQWYLRWLFFQISYSRWV